MNSPVIDTVMEPASAEFSDPSDGTGVGGRRRRTVLWTAVAAGAMLVALAVTMFSSHQQEAGTRQAASRLIGHPVPLSAGQTVNGAPFDPASLHGKWALVNFFASWCIPCQHEHAALVTFSERHAADASLISIAFNDDDSSVKSFFASRGGDWPVVRDPNGQTALDFGVTGIPESYIVNPDGIVVAKVVGGVEADALDSLLQRLGDTAAPAAGSGAPAASAPAVSTGAPAASAPGAGAAGGQS